MDNEKKDKEKDVKSEKIGLEIDIEDMEKVNKKDPSKDHDKKEIPKISENAWEKAVKETKEKERKEKKEKNE